MQRNPMFGFEKGSGTLNSNMVSSGDVKWYKKDNLVIIQGYIIVNNNYSNPNEGALVTGLPTPQSTFSYIVPIESSTSARIAIRESGSMVAWYSTLPMNKDIRVDMVYMI